MGLKVLHSCDSTKALSYAYILDTQLRTILESKLADSYSLKQTIACQTRLCCSFCTSTHG